MTAMPRAIEDVLAELNASTGRTKRAIVEEAAERREEISPLLISYLKEVVDDPKNYFHLRYNDDLLPYGLLLLGYFKEESSHQLMLSLFRLPHHNLETMIGDLTTATLPVLLLRTCGGSLEGLKDLVTCRECDDFVRWAAMEGLTYAVGSGIADRDDIVSFLADLLTGEEAEPGSYFWLGVANSLCDLHPADVIDKLTAAYSRGLIPERELTTEEIEDADELGLEYAMEKLREEAERRLPDDLPGLVSLFEAYSPQPALIPNHQLTKQKKKLKQSKKKMAKASRRKNR